MGAKSHHWPMATLTVGSYPRSGNHYLVHLLRDLVPSLGVHWVQHNMTLMNKSSHAVSICRRPDDCISSWLVYLSDISPDTADASCLWYIDYYSMIMQMSDRVYVASFDDLISNSSDVITAALKFHRLVDDEISGNIPIFDATKHSGTLDIDAMTVAKSHVLRSAYYKSACQMYDSLVKA